MQIFCIAVHLNGGMQSARTAGRRRTLGGPPVVGRQLQAFLPASKTQVSAHASRSLPAVSVYLRQ